jgi:hypothetical protein
VTLGFGLLYKKLNRYEKGLEHVSRGLDYLDRGLAVDSCSWPGLPLQPLVSQYTVLSLQQCFVIFSLNFTDRPVFTFYRSNKISDMIDKDRVPHGD